MPSADTDVLIVGAGPTGLMLANQLVRQGVRMQLIDRHAGPSLQTRALGVQARSLEIYAQLGIAERAIALGMPADGANLWAGGRRTGRVPLGAAGRSITPYPYILVLGQDDNERIMGERLREQGFAPQWNTELVAIDQQPDHALATLREADGRTRTIRAGWIAGCDGARSTVRERCGIGFPGAPYEHVFFVADVEATGHMVPGEVNVYLWRDGFHLFFPMRGTNHWRIVGILPAALRDREGVDFEAVVPSLRGEAGLGLAFSACSWFSTYRIHHRSAARFRERRCFLLGDAAHIHSPVGAQGMNTGLQDAANLGWKLALVARGEADAALLDSYEEERLPIARRLLATTDRGFRLVVSDSALAGLVRTHLIARVAALLMGREAIQRAAFRTVSQTGIHYRAHTLSRTLGALPKGAPQAGDRFPWLTVQLRPEGPAEDLFRRLDGTQFTLISFGAENAPKAADTLGRRVKRIVVPADPANAAALAAAGIAQPSFYLVRPDGYIGLAGTRLAADAVLRYLAERVRFVEPAAPAAALASR